MTNLKENFLRKKNFICFCGGDDKKLSVFIEKEQNLIFQNLITTFKELQI